MRLRRAAGRGPGGRRREAHARKFEWHIRGHARDVPSRSPRRYCEYGSAMSKLKNVSEGQGRDQDFRRALSRHEVE